MSDLDLPASRHMPPSVRLAAGEIWFWGLLEALPGAVIITDSARRIRGWNARAAHLYGLEPDASVGQNLLEVAPFAGASGLGKLVLDSLEGSDRPSDGWFLYSDDGHGVAVLPLAGKADAEGEKELGDGTLEGDHAAPAGPDGLVVIVKQQGASAKQLREKERELQHLNQRLRFDALHDMLTGLPNRTLLLDRLEQVLSRRHQERARDAAVLFLDFDRFKIVNDSLGHSVGDAMLKAIADTLTKVVRPEDTVARLGGDEFVILMDHVEEPQLAVDLAERIKVALADPMVVEERLIFTSASIGIVPSVMGYDSAEDVLRDADTAMYAAKDAGRARHRLFDKHMRDQALAALDLENGLWRALATNEFRVRYKPILRLDDGGVMGFSALIRWQHPQRGLLAPKDFLRTATEMGIGRDIDRIVWRQACRSATEWRARFGSGLLLSLHFNARHFLSPEPEAKLLDTLRELGADMSQTAIELTEGTLHDASDVAEAALMKIVKSGVRLHLDNFGSGHHSLYSIQRFQVGAVKIDHHLVQSLERESSVELVKAICAMAESMRLDVIAKGVTTARQLETLRQLGCSYAQGPYFSPPLDEDEAREFLQGRPAA